MDKREPSTQRDIWIRSLSIVEWEMIPVLILLQPAAKNSQEIFEEHWQTVLMVPSTTEMATYNGDLTTLKRSIVADVEVCECR